VYTINCNQNHKPSQYFVSSHIHWNPTSQIKSTVTPYSHRSIPQCPHTTFEFLHRTNSTIYNLSPKWTVHDSTSHSPSKSCLSPVLQLHPYKRLDATPSNSVFYSFKKESRSSLEKGTPPKLKPWDPMSTRIRSVWFSGFICKIEVVSLSCRDNLVIC